MKKYYYGIRYLGGNRTCTTGNAHPHTGRMSRAIEAACFDNKIDRDEWVNREDLYKSSGNGGGERIPATLALLRKHRLGMTIEEFNEYVDFLKMDVEY